MFFKQYRFRSHLGAQLGAVLGGVGAVLGSSGVLLGRSGAVEAKKNKDKQEIGTCASLHVARFPFLLGKVDRFSAALGAVLGSLGSLLGRSWGGLGEVLGGSWGVFGDYRQ